MKLFSKDGYLPLKSIGLMFAGSLIYSLAMNLLIIPAGMYSGGILGIAQLIRELLASFNIVFDSVDISGVIYFAINVPLLVLAYKSLGKGFFLKTIVCTVFYTVFLTFIPVPNSPVLSDTIVCCLAGGVLSGIGIGMTLFSGGCGGGEEIISVYLTTKHSSLSVGKITLFINIFVFGCCAVFFDLSVAVYSIIYSALSSIALDKIHFQNITMDMFIISKRNDIEKIVYDTVKRGATRINAKGGYSGEDTNMYLVVLSKNESLILKRELQSVDPDAFILIHDDVDVEGNFEMRLH